MQQHSGNEPRLSADRAFVVQFYADAAVAQGRVSGRVEHVMSGQATHFASLEELLAFITRVLPAPDA
jgi:hypothetical protein